MRPLPFHWLMGIYHPFDYSLNMPSKGSSCTTKYPRPHPPCFQGISAWLMGLQRLPKELIIISCFVLSAARNTDKPPAFPFTIHFFLWLNHMMKAGICHLWHFYGNRWVSILLLGMHTGGQALFFFLDNSLVISPLSHPLQEMFPH